MQSNILSGGYRSISVFLIDLFEEPEAVCSQSTEESDNYNGDTLHGNIIFSETKEDNGEWILYIICQEIWVTLIMNYIDFSDLFDSGHFLENWLMP